LTAESNPMMSAVVVAFARLTASRRLSTPSFGSMMSVVVETAYVAIGEIPRKLLSQWPESRRRIAIRQSNHLA
jgi:hypothetical protein